MLDKVARLGDISIMSVVRSTDAAMTADAFLAWSERQSGGERHELLDGRVYAMAAERAVHTRMKYAMTRLLEAGIAHAGLPCEAFVDGMAVRVDDASVFEPDVIVRCGSRLPDDAIVILDPIIVVEVASPSTQRVDALLKLTRYFRNASIVHYLIVMPNERSVVHHRRGEGEHIETAVHASGRLRLDPPGLDLDLGTIFPPSADLQG